MSFKKEKLSADESSLGMAPLKFPNKVLGKVNPVKPEMTTDLPAEVDVDVDMREVYFLIMHFLSAGPCKRTYGQLWNELLEHQLLPRRYHAWYSRSGARSGNEDDDGMSLPLCYLKLVERYCDKRIQPSGQELVSPSSCIRRKESVDKERNTSLQPKDILCTHQWNAGEASIYEHVSISCSARVPEDASASHSSNRKDIYFHHPQFGLISVPVPVGAVPHQSLGAGYGSILQPMLYSKTSFPSHNLPAVEKTVQIPDQSNSDDHNVINQSQCNEFHHHEENHQNPHSKQKVDREPGVSTDISCAPMEQLTRSASCSENVNKDSRSNGSGETVGATRVTGAALENGNESGVQEGNINRSNCGRSRREAALIKFCLKRKDRCFEKKVRYHSRKMLAEQRPRVKGQFVRQKVSESTAPKDVED